MGGLGPAASPFAGMLADLPATMPPGWQSVDLAVRALKTAMRAADMQKAEKVVAVLQSVTNTLEKLVSAYTKGTAGASASSMTSTAESAVGSPPAADADAQPSASADSEES